MPVLIHATRDMYTCMLRFNFILGLIFISLCFKLIIIYYHAQKQREIKIKPRIKLNHNIYKQSFFRIRSSNPAKQMFSNQAIGVWHEKASIRRTKEIKRYLLSKELFEEIRMGILFVGFTLEA